MPVNVQLPPELWLAIANLLSREQLVALMTLNRVFFFAAMDEKYKSATVVTNSSCFPARMLRRLKYLPFISSRIQYLSIEHDPYGDYPKPKISSRLSQRWCTMKRLILVCNAKISRVLSNSQTDLPLQPYPRRYETEMLASLFSNLTSLRHLYLNLDCFCYPVTGKVDPDISFLFSALETSLGATIETLALRGDLRQYRIFMGNDIHLPCLKTLKLDTMNDPSLWAMSTFTTINISNFIPILRGITRFINNQASHLDALSIETSIGIDLPDLFSSIQKLPILCSLELHLRMICLSQTSVSKPGLDAFLRLHSPTLRRLDVLYVCYPQPSVHSPDQWILPCMNDNQLAFTNLEEVKLRQMTPSTPMQPILALFLRASNTLKDVCILDHPLLEPDLAVIIESLSHCHRLTRLHFTVAICAITVELFDHLSVSLPHLRELVIHMDVQQTSDDSAYFEPTVDSSPLLQDLKTRIYTDWCLDTFTVKEGSDVLILSDEVEAILRKCIPSLRHFPNDPPPVSFELYPIFTTV